MIIQGSHIQRTSAHYLNVQDEELTYRRETEIPSTSPPSFQVTFSREAGSMSESRFVSMNALSTPVEASEPVAETPDADSREQAKLDILLKTIEKITGKSMHYSRIGFTLKGKNEPAEASTRPLSADSAAPSGTDTGQVRPESGRRRIETYTEHVHHEEESTAVVMTGTVKTADGREITLDIALAMSREFVEKQEEYSLAIAPLTDPLVISYDGTAADLTGMAYSFDLNSDGIEEDISFVTPGTGGFLALDRNGDGIVNDGGEVFGTITGDGFQELAVHDQDGNGWIDAGDSVYHDLSVWEKTAAGEDRLIALADTGIGAIYLNAVDSPFRITDTGNRTLGQVRATGIYLRNDGSAGTVQQIDLAT